MMSKIYVSQVKYFCYMYCLSYKYKFYYIRLSFHIYCIFSSWCPYLCINILNYFNFSFNMLSLIKKTPNLLQLRAFILGVLIMTYIYYVFVVLSRLLYNNNICNVYFISKKKYFFCVIYVYFLCHFSIPKVALSF